MLPLIAAPYATPPPRRRHKLVVHVLCGELKGQALHSSSRCLWDTGSDGWASETFLNETLFCSAQVFALYFE